MQTMLERVGPVFSAEGTLMARAETRKAIAAIAARIRHGMREEDSAEMAKEVISVQCLALSSSLTRIRCGINTK